MLLPLFTQDRVFITTVIKTAKLTEIFINYIKSINKSQLAWLFTFLLPTLLKYTNLKTLSILILSKKGKPLFGKSKYLAIYIVANCQIHNKLGRCIDCVFISEKVIIRWRTGV